MGADWEMETGWALLTVRGLTDHILVRAWSLASSLFSATRVYLLWRLRDLATGGRIGQVLGASSSLWNLIQKHRVLAELCAGLLDSVSGPGNPGRWALVTSRARLTFSSQPRKEQPAPLASICTPLSWCVWIQPARSWLALICLHLIRPRLGLRTLSLCLEETSVGKRFMVERV